MTKTGRKLHRDTEEVHSNTPRLKPTCIFSPPSQRQWQEGGGEEEEAEPTFNWRKEGRKDWGRKMQKQYSVIIQDHDLQKIVEESPPITHTKTRHQLWLEIKNCGQLAKQKGKFNQILINESKDGWIQQNQKGR